MNRVAFVIAIVLAAAAASPLLFALPSCSPKAADASGPSRMQLVEGPGFWENHSSVDLFVYTDSATCRTCYIATGRGTGIWCTERAEAVCP